jgi:hypothetical protein
VAVAIAGVIATELATLHATESGFRWSARAFDFPHTIITADTSSDLVTALRADQAERRNTKQGRQRSDMRP